MKLRVWNSMFGIPVCALGGRNVWNTVWCTSEGDLDKRLGPQDILSVRTVLRLMMTEAAMMGKL